MRYYLATNKKVAYQKSSLDLDIISNYHHKFSESEAIKTYQDLSYLELYEDVNSAVWAARNEGKTKEQEPISYEYCPPKPPRKLFTFFKSIEEFGTFIKPITTTKNIILIFEIEGPDKKYLEKYKIEKYFESYDPHREFTYQMFCLEKSYKDMYLSLVSAFINNSEEYISGPTNRNYSNPDEFLMLMQSEIDMIDIDMEVKGFKKEINEIDDTNPLLTDSEIYDLDQIGIEFLKNNSSKKLFP